MGYIYLITNKINKKQYIGQSIKADILDRWKQHKRVNKRMIGQVLFNAYKKYGIDNFDYKVICICFDEDTDKFEEEYIKKYNSLYPNGYNLLSGGKNRKHHEYTISRIKEKLGGINHPNYGKKFNPERCKAISERTKGEKNPNYGKKYTKEEILQRNETRRVQNLRKFGTANCIVNQETRDKISKSLKDYYNNNIISNKTNNNHNCIGVNQYTKDGIFVKSYYSISEAGRQVGLAPSFIGRACSTEPKFSSYKTAGGFIWKREAIINLSCKE